MKLPKFPIEYDKKNIHFLFVFHFILFFFFYVLSMYIRLVYTERRCNLFAKNKQQLEFVEVEIRCNIWRSTESNNNKNSIENRGEKENVKYSYVELVAHIVGKYSLIFFFFSLISFFFFLSSFLAPFFDFNFSAAVFTSGRNWVLDFRIYIYIYSKLRVIKLKCLFSRITGNRRSCHLLFFLLFFLFRVPLSYTRIAWSFLANVIRLMSRVKKKNYVSMPVNEARVMIISNAARKWWPFKLFIYNEFYLYKSRANNNNFPPQSFSIGFWPANSNRGSNDREQEEVEEKNVDWSIMPSQRQLLQC